MIRNKVKLIVFSVLLSSGFATMGISQDPPLIKSNGKAQQLYVNEAPFLMISGELQNSSASTISYMEPIWPALVKMNLNSVIVSVSWDQFEPIEGEYDFTLLEEIIKKTKEHDLKLVIIWFGTWKNGYSSYTPVWVKKDINRFYRLKDINGLNLQRISPFCKEAMIADAKAYSVLNELSGMILKYQDTGKMHGILKEEDETGVTFTMGKYIAQVSYDNKEKPSYGLIIQEAEDEFIISGINFSVTFSATDRNMNGVIGEALEGEYIGNKWVTTRFLNGDDTGHHRVLRASGRRVIQAASAADENSGVARVPIAPGIYKVKMYQYPFLFSLL